MSPGVACSTISGEGDLERLIGVILAAGRGSRLGARTRERGKGLLPVAGRPMLLYALVTLMRAGLRRIVTVASPRDVERVSELLSDGQQWGLELPLVVQAEPHGIAAALLTAGPLLGGASCAVILADNLFVPPPDLAPEVASFRGGAQIFAVAVEDPRRFGVVVLDDAGRILGLEEKPSRPRSNLAVPGLYLYDDTVLARAAALTPSPRGELEITDLNLSYQRDEALRARRLSPEIQWLDAGTPDDLAAAEAQVQAHQDASASVLACPEAVALELGRISPVQLRQQLTGWPDSPYKRHLADLLGEHS